MQASAKGLQHEYKLAKMARAKNGSIYLAKLKVELSHYKPQAHYGRTNR